MSLEIESILMEAGITPPRVIGLIDPPSRCTLYVHAKLLSSPVVCETGVVGPRAAVCFLGLRDQAQPTPNDVHRLNALFSEFCRKRGVTVSRLDADRISVFMASWSLRHKLHELTIEFLESDEIRQIVWPVMNTDFKTDEMQLRQFVEESDSAGFAAFAEGLVKPERAWAFSHFNLIQKREASGFHWVLDVGSDLHLLDCIEQVWRGKKLAGDVDLVEMVTAAAQFPIDGGPTWISESLEFKSTSLSGQAVHEFVECLRTFMNSIYLVAVPQMKVAASSGSMHARMA